MCRSIEGAADAPLQQWLIKYSISIKSLMAGDQFLCKAAIFMKCSDNFLISDQNILRMIAFYGNFNTSSRPGQVIFGIYRACVKSLIKRTSSATMRG